MASSKAEGDHDEYINKQEVANKFAAIRFELNQIDMKVTELEMDASEHSLVINAIQPLDPCRRCYQMIGGVLVERTINEVLLAVQRNKEGNDKVIFRLKVVLGKRIKEISDFVAKYMIMIQKEQGKEKDDSTRKKDSAQRVLVGPAGGG